MWKVLSRILVLLSLLALSIGYSAAKSSLTPPEWRIEQANDVPYLVWNEMPYFGRFQTNHPQMYLNGIWEFVTDPEAKSDSPPDKGWEPISVPGVWNYLRPEMLHYIGVGWYRLKFTPDKNLNGDLIRLLFGGVNMRCRVWLNVNLLGEHEGGYTAFSFDVTKAIKHDAENLLLVRVDNSMTYTSLPPLNYEGSRMGWWEYGGIHRSVYLEAHPQVTIFKIAFREESICPSSNVLRTDVLVWDRRTQPSLQNIEVEAGAVDTLTGATTKVLYNARESFNGSSKNIWGLSFRCMEIESAKLWSPEDPNGRYKLTITLKSGDTVLDSASADFGFRHFEANPKGLFLNKIHYYIRGINRHEDDPVTGLVETPEVLARDIDLLKSLHINHMRTAHYPNDPAFYDLTDINGIGITEEIPLYQAGIGALIWIRDRVQRGLKIGPMRFSKVKPSQFRNKELVDNAILSLVETIERDRNHPSILAWSIGNENWTYTSGACSTYSTLKDIAKKFDPDRPVTFAIMSFEGFGPLRERCAGIADFISANEYYGWYVGEVAGVEGMLRKLHEWFPDKPIVVSEFGAGAVMDPSKVRKKNMYGEKTYDPKYQSYVIAEQWKIIRRLPFVWGGMPWVFADFRNGWYKEIHPIPYFNLKGVLTYDRKPKPAYYVLRDIYIDIEHNPPEWAK